MCIRDSHARISNIINNGKSKHIDVDGNFDSSLLLNTAEISLIKSLYEFPEIMKKTLNTLEPQSIANHLHDIASEFHKFYAKCRVITDDIELTKSRIHLIKSVKIVLANGLNILGIQAPEKM